MRWGEGEGVVRPSARRAVTLTEGPVGLRPLRTRDAAAWREVRVRNEDWLRPWEPTSPQLPLFRSGLGSYISMLWSMRRDAEKGLALPWVVTYEGCFAGQLTVGGIIGGAASSGQVGYWIDQQLAGHGVIPTAVALAVDHCFFTAGLHRVEANIRPENTASIRVVEKLGFREEGLRRRYLHIDGAWRDHLSGKQRRLGLF